MNNIQAFTHEEFGQIRGGVNNGTPEMVLRDICEAFGESNYRRVASRLDEDEKGVSQIDTPGGPQRMIVVNESGLYSALFAMQPEKARGVSGEYIEERQEKLKQFKRWVTHEVLPSIRKTGSYQAPMNDDELMARAYVLANKKIEALEISIEQKQQKIDALKPKALVGEALTLGNQKMSIGTLAKYLSQAGFKIGQNQLFKLLRADRYLMYRDGDNVPTQRAMDLKLFEMERAKAGEHSDGSPRYRTTTRVTQKGVRYFIEKYAGQTSMEVK